MSSRKNRCDRLPSTVISTVTLAGTFPALRRTLQTFSRTLRTQYSGLSSAGGARALAARPFEHGRVFQHIRQYQKSYLRTADIHVLQLRHSAVAVRHCDILHLTIHIVLRLDQLPAIHFAGVRFAGYDMALGLVKHFDGNSYGHREGRMVRVLWETTRFSFLSFRFFLFSNEY